MSAVVYWLLDAEDNILYIGSTNHIGTRIKNHAKTQPWWSSVASVAYSTYMLKSEARRVEREDIITLHPVHNILRYLPKPVRVPRPARVLRPVRIRKPGRFRNPQLPPSPKQILLQLKYPGDLAGDIRNLRAAGSTWCQIAELVSARSGYDVSYESLRSWYGEAQKPAA